MNGDTFIPPLRELPPHRLDERTRHLQAEVARKRRPALFAARRQRVLVFAALLIAVAIALLATPALGLRDTIHELFGAGKPAPEVVVRRFDTMNEAPPGSVPGVIAHKARAVMDVSLPGYGKWIVWAAPTRSGGFCTSWNCDRDRRLRFNETVVIAGSSSKIQPRPWSRDVTVIFEGDTLIHGAAGVEVRFADGSSERTPIVWVSRPIDAGFFVYEVPSEHWDAGKQPVALAVVNAHGEQLAIGTKDASYFRDAQHKGLAPPTGAKPPPAPPPPQARTFTDPAGDARSSVDITALRITEAPIPEEPDSTIDFELTLSGPPGLEASGPLIALDVDQNPDTGSSFYGTEVEIGLAGGDNAREAEPIFYRAHGWSFRGARPPKGGVGWSIGKHTVTFSVRRAALGLKPNAGFNVVAASAAQHPDTAPDIGTFNYQRVQGKPPPLGADRRAPKVLAFDSTGSRGKEARIGYWVLEGRGKTRQVIRVFRGHRVLTTLWTPLADANPFDVSETTWRVPANLRGSLRFSVRSIDAAGNKSALSWAQVLIR